MIGGSRWHGLPCWSSHPGARGEGWRGEDAVLAAGGLSRCRRAEQWAAQVPPHRAGACSRVLPTCSPREFLGASAKRCVRPSSSSSPARIRAADVSPRQVSRLCPKELVCLCFARGELHAPAWRSPVGAWWPCSARACQPNPGLYSKLKLPLPPRPGGRSPDVPTTAEAGQTVCKELCDDGREAPSEEQGLVQQDSRDRSPQPRAQPATAGTGPAPSSTPASKPHAGINRKPGEPRGHLPVAGSSGHSRCPGTG
ncbi:uncharacterized protein LOC119873717 isoform X4 [Canis lupus familiaris]|uniref:uncharacterized protein LOC118350056 n=1 Tax=Canis lupus dingo TaxID=286419 RepID=UPI0018F4BC01|nr:uncharacterized protein LOC119873717 isoform X4 [Canis lupus familiaris]XP_048971184.1 uncharacterized protein LOC118350056 [Canis lupus dingo]